MVSLSHHFGFSMIIFKHSSCDNEHNGQSPSLTLVTTSMLSGCSHPSCAGVCRQGLRGGADWLQLHRGWEALALINGAAWLERVFMTNLGKHSLACWEGGLLGGVKGVKGASLALRNGVHPGSSLPHQPFHQSAAGAAAAAAENDKSEYSSPSLRLPQSQRPRVSLDVEYPFGWFTATTLGCFVKGVWVFHSSDIHYKGLITTTLELISIGPQSHFPFDKRWTWNYCSFEATSLLITDPLPCKRIYFLFFMIYEHSTTETK